MRFHEFCNWQEFLNFLEQSFLYWVNIYIYVIKLQTFVKKKLLCFEIYKHHEQQTLVIFKCLFMFKLDEIK